MADDIFRWSGVLLIAGAILLGVAIVLLSLKPVIGQPKPPGPSALLLLSSIPLLLSLPAMYARQPEAAGWPGLAGHGLLQTGILLLVVVAAPTFLFPSLNMALGENLVAFLLGIALTPGLLLTGTAILRAGVIPHWTGILLLAATAGFFITFFITEFLPPTAGQLGSALCGALLAFALAWIGGSFWTGVLEPAV